MKITTNLPHLVLESDFEPEPESETKPIPNFRYEGGFEFVPKMSLKATNFRFWIWRIGLDRFLLSITAEDRNHASIEIVRGVDVLQKAQSELDLGHDEMSRLEKDLERLSILTEQAL